MVGQFAVKYFLLIFRDYHRPWGRILGTNRVHVNSRAASPAPAGGGDALGFPRPAPPGPRGRPHEAVLPGPLRHAGRAGPGPAPWQGLHLPQGHRGTGEAARHLPGAVDGAPAQGRHCPGRAGRQRRLHAGAPAGAHSGAGGPGSPGGSPAPGRVPRGVRLLRPAWVLRAPGPCGPRAAMRSAAPTGASPWPRSWSASGPWRPVRPRTTPSDPRRKRSRPLPAGHGQNGYSPGASISAYRGWLR